MWAKGHCGSSQKGKMKKENEIFEGRRDENVDTRDFAKFTVSGSKELLGGKPGSSAAVGYSFQR